jgi:hypothetical protein
MPQKDGHDWLFYDAHHHGIGVDDVISLGRDGTLISHAKKPYFIASSQEFSEFVFSVEFMFPQAQVQGNPYISIASTLPNPAGKTWDQQIPLGIELKLNPRTSGPNGLGEVILPRADFKATVASSQTIKDRRVSPTATAKLNIPAWNTLEIVADAKRNVTFLINGTVVNSLANVETTKGHVVFFPSPAEMRLRNAKVNAAGEEKPLLFQNIESSNPQ